MKKAPENQGLSVDTEPSGACLYSSINHSYSIIKENEKLLIPFPIPMLRLSR